MWKRGERLRKNRDRASTGVGDKFRCFPHRRKKTKKVPHPSFHISSFFGGIVDGSPYSYLALILVLISLMISAISGEVFIMVSTCLIECITVVWSLPSKA